MKENNQKGFQFDAFFQNRMQVDKRQSVNLGLFFLGLFFSLVTPFVGAVLYFLPYIGDFLGSIVFSPSNPFWAFPYIPLIAVAIAGALLLKRRSYYLGGLLITSTLLTIGFSVLFSLILFTESP